MLGTQNQNYEIFEPLSLFRLSITTFLIMDLPPLPPSRYFPEHFHLALYPQIKTLDPAICKEDSYFPSGTLASFASDLLEEHLPIESS